MMKSFLALVAFSFVETASGAITAATWAPDTYVTGIAPTTVKFQATFASALPVTSKIVITPSTTIFTADAAVVCTTDVAATTTLTCASVGAILTCDTAVAEITAATATTITCTSNLAVNGAAADVLTAKIKVRNAADDADVEGEADFGAAPAYQFISATATITSSTWIPSTYVTGETPANVKFLATYATEVAIGNKIVIIPSTTIFTADAAVVCTTTVAETTTLTCASASGTLTCTTAVAAITAATATTITCTSNLAANGAAATTLTAKIKHTVAGGNDVDACVDIGTTPAYTFVAATTATNSSNASSNSTNTTTAAGILINSAAAVSPGAVALLLASLF